jgi:type VI protein secretion system component VasK
VGRLDVLPRRTTFSSLLTEALIISGVAMDLVGAAVLSHAHNAESIVQLREEDAAVEKIDAISTHAQLLAEKRIGLLILTAGLILYLIGVVLESPEGAVYMGLLAGGVVIVGIVLTSIVGNNARRKAREAEEKQDGERLPEH